MLLQQIAVALATSFTLFQHPISVASNGGSFLVLWQTEQQTDGFPVLAGLHLMRIDADGQVRGAYERTIPAATCGSPPVDCAALAANGTDYVFASMRGSDVVTQRVGDDGEPLGQTHIVASRGRIHSLVFSGSSLLLLVEGGGIGGGTAALLLDHDGAVVRELPPFWGAVRWAGAQRGEFVVIDYTYRGHELHRFFPNGPRADIPLDWDRPWYMQLELVAASDERLFAQEYEHPESTTKVFDAYGGTLWRSKQSVCPTVPGFGRTISGWWDGSRFIGACVDPDRRLFATPYAHDGAKLGEPVLLSASAVSAPMFATNGATRLLVWVDRRFGGNDVVARGVFGADSIAPGAAPQLVSDPNRARRTMPRH
jgi:hypothetical protein